jgi:ribose-phosphate pyrophosphokinase
VLTSNVDFKVIQFPCGEPHVTVTDTPIRNPINITFDFESSGEILVLLLLVDAVKRLGYSLGELTMPYVPFGRQDRVANAGEAFSIGVFCDLINSLGFHIVRITDPHSDVTTALLKNVRVETQAQIFAPMLKDRSDFYLISPDAGAMKKMYSLGSVVKSLGIVQCSKIRDTVTGEITGTQVHIPDLEGKDCFIVDDICDGGRTFTEIAKKLKELHAGKIHLMVSHGFFTKGLEVFNGLIDHIYTRKGQIK